MKITTFVAIPLVATVAGCAPQQPRPYNPNLAQCEYEATANTVNINNVFTQAWERQKLIDMCLRAKGG